MVTIVFRGNAEDFGAAIEGLDAHEPLEIVGNYLASQAQDAHTKQALGDIRWPPRYPSQDQPFVNVAGLLDDLNRGRGISSRRFERRPALTDTGRLQGSYDYTVSGESVFVGTNVEYAAAHQWGDTTVTRITDKARKKLGDFLKTKRGSRYREKLGFLFNRDVLETDLVARPFLGIPDQAELDIKEIVEDWVVKRLEADSG